MTNPGAFLDLVRRARRGRLKIYVGFASGVGKTYHMLEEAHALQAHGTDVVLGFIETHGRPDTEALVEGLEVVPRKKIAYRGGTLEELDLDALLARAPEIAVVDELAHTNAPGSRHPKRYLDVLELLDAGINVISAVNVQHLESLNDLVHRAAGLVVRETIPDSFLERADQVVNLDLAVEDLLERLREGKIVSEAEIPTALQNFFREQKLAALRELSLREVAESLDRELTALTPKERREAIGRIMVCISPASPRAEVLLRRGSRVAAHLGTEWFVVYVETPAESRMSAEKARRLEANLDHARDHGAEVMRLRARDPVQALLDFARSHEVQRIIIGRTARTLPERLTRRSFVERMVRESRGFDLSIVSAED
ncbi:universal stress protein [Vulgatibacter incomptus]|uniref:Osmosensitive K+ channel histidine kinase KdpD n=1 Tax=Vulgatibacter incomptus TaxID=1391653 RepID=A0A0K1P8C5_9BACT|nr:universal stress protein [Vulgatibacter incomptus]AKU89747.1 Osmosensitive K+ channel histidine kinase KdpD [Vulgatibacter incomptus]